MEFSVFFYSIVRQLVFHSGWEGRESDASDEDGSMMLLMMMIMMCLMAGFMNIRVGVNLI